MSGSVTRVEVQGWLSLIVAIVGLYFTATQGTATLDAIAVASSVGSLPPEFSGAQGLIRVFFFLLMLVIFGALLLIGLAIMLAQLFRAMGAKAPALVAFCLLIGLLCLTATLTLAIFGHAIWILGGLGSLLLLVLSAMATHVDPDDGESIGVFWGFLLFGGVAALLLGIFLTAMVSTTPAATGVEPAVSEKGTGTEH